MYWNFSQVDDFLQTLISYDNGSILENCLEVIKEHFLKDPVFNPNIFIQSPLQQQNLCAWIINVVYYVILLCYMLYYSMRYIYYQFLSLLALMGEFLFLKVFIILVI